MTNQDNPEDRIGECIFESIEESIIIEDIGMEDSSVPETAPEQEDQPESPQEMEPEEGPVSEVELRQKFTPESKTGSDVEVESSPESAPVAVPEEIASDIHSETSPELESSPESVPDSSPQFVIEEPTSHQAAADLTPILNVLTTLQTQISGLREEFNSKMRYDASKKEIIDRQYQELDAYHREIHEKLNKAIVMDLIAEIDGAERSAEHYSALEATPENYAKLKKPMPKTCATCSKTTISIPIAPKQGPLSITNATAYSRPLRPTILPWPKPFRHLCAGDSKKTEKSSAPKK